jgi:hypothetical protein
MALCDSGEPCECTHDRRDCVCEFNDGYHTVSANEILVRATWSRVMGTWDRVKRVAHFAQRNLVPLSDPGPWPRLMEIPAHVMYEHWEPKVEDDSPLPDGCDICRFTHESLVKRLSPRVLHDGGPYAPPDPKPWVINVHPACFERQCKQRAKGAFPFHAEEFRDLAETFGFDGIDDLTPTGADILSVYHHLLTRPDAQGRSFAFEYALDAEKEAMMAVSIAKDVVHRHMGMPVADLPELVADFLVPAPPRRAKRRREETD